MHDVVQLVSRHGYAAIILAVLAEALGLPVPAALALVAAGAAVASHALRAPVAFILAVGAMFLGDSLLYVLGRQTGWRLLGFLCKLSMNPETCILRSAEYFHKRGKTALLLAKFVPGINTMAPPLAGSMKMAFQRFAYLDLLGTSLYIVCYGALGFVFRDFVTTMVNSFQAAGKVVEIALLLALFGYVGYRVWLFLDHRLYRIVPRIQVEELVRKLQSDEAHKVLLVDVRSHGYYDAEANRIFGSVRIEPNNLSEEIKTLPRDREIYVYCT
jgi:membrane protein DedA with SNARE-associated domain